MKPGDGLPPLPKFKCRAAEKRRDAAFEILERHRGKVPAGDAFRELCAAVGAATLAPADGRGVVETVRSLPPAPLTRRELWLLAWRLADRLPDIRKGRAVRPWSRQPADEWVPFEILSGAAARNRAGDHGFRYALRAIGGAPCAEEITAWWSRARIARMALDLGFTRDRRRFPLQDPAQLARLRFAGFVTVELSAERPAFRFTAVPPGFRTYNQKILKQRFHRVPPCPEAFDHPCHLCPAGYAAGGVVCQAAIRPRALYLGQCISCQREGWLDPARGDEVCDDCRKIVLRQ